MKGHILMWVWVGLLVMGSIAGVASGMFGIGGGVIIVPALMLIGFSQVQANGTSLAALLLPVGVFGVISYHNNNMVRWRASFIIAGGLVVGAVGGAQLALSMDPTLLLRLYGVFLLYVGWRMAQPRQWFNKNRTEAEPANAEKTETVAAEKPIDGILPVTALGLLAGVASGMFGIGGGAVIVPILVTFMRFPQKVAVATSLGALLLPVGAGGAWVYFQNNQLNLMTAVPVALGLLAGAWFGARITISLPSATVKRMYGIFLLVIAIRFLLGL